MTTYLFRCDCPLLLLYRLGDNRHFRDMVVEAARTSVGNDPYDVLMVMQNERLYVSGLVDKSDCNCSPECNLLESWTYKGITFQKVSSKPPQT